MRINEYIYLHGDSQVLLVVKNPVDNAGDVRDTGSTPGLGRYLGGERGEIPWAEKPAGYSPWGYKESDMTERLSTLALDWIPGCLTGFRFSITKWCHVHTGTSDTVKLY